MRKGYKTVVLTLILMLTLMSTATVYAESANNHPEPATTTEVKLTEKQKAYLAEQYKDILKKEQKVIATYVKYGVITEQQGKIISAHLEKRYVKLEQSGFMPHWGKHKGKHEHHKHHKDKHKE